MSRPNSDAGTDSHKLPMFGNRSPRDTMNSSLASIAMFACLPAQCELMPVLNRKLQAL